jgi:preprotein translocase subunit SecB
MKAQLSPLVLVDFAILNCNFKFITPTNEGNIQKWVASYELDIDFALPLPEKEDKITRIFIKASINQGKVILPGYSVFAEGVAFFKLSPEANLSKEDKDNLLHYSAVSIALNSLRGFISSLTANAPHGRYILPSIDVNALFKQKTADTEKTVLKNKKIATSKPKK